MVWGVTSHGKILLVGVDWATGYRCGRLAGVGADSACLGFVDRYSVKIELDILGIGLLVKVIARGDVWLGVTG